MSLYSRVVIAPLGHIVSLDGFFDDARRLRRELDARLSDARDPFDPSRFAWEPWHIQGQFSQARAPARSFFADGAYAAFERRLLAWSGRALGLSAFGGPPWLSSLTDGDYQGLHRDSPNGEFAFSFGLSNGVGFRGGETQIASFDLLDYFRRGAHAPARADSPLFTEIVPRFNRLVAFDARLPHAVRMVEGPRHVRDGRVAIQGWLTAGGPLVRAGQGAREIAASAIARVSKRARGASGLLSVRVERGTARVVCDTLVDTTARSARDAVHALLLAAIARAPFPKDADLVVPVVVQEGAARVPGDGKEIHANAAAPISGHARPASILPSSPSSPRQPRPRTRGAVAT